MANAALTTSEIEALRFLLGYGNLSQGASVYTRDGFNTLFYSAVVPYLTTGPQTSATTQVEAGSSTTVTPLSMDGVVVYEKLVVDVGAAAEKVIVQSVTSTTFTALFANAHPSTGYPIAVQSGVTRVRELLGQAERLVSSAVGEGITQTAGLKQLGRGEIEWFEAGSVLASTNKQLAGVIALLAGLIGIPVAGGGSCRSDRLEAY